MIDSTTDQKFEQNTPTVQDEMNLPPPDFATKNETGKTKETVIANNGAEDDYIISNSSNIKLNELKVKDIVNSQKEEITPDIIEEETPKLPEKKVSNLNFNNTNNKQSNNNYVVNKIPKKKASTKQRKTDTKNIYTYEERTYETNFESVKYTVIFTKKETKE